MLDAMISEGAEASGRCYREESATSSRSALYATLEEEDFPCMLVSFVCLIKCYVLQQ